MLEMPLMGDDIAQECVESPIVLDQAPVEDPRIPIVQDPADIEDDGRRLSQNGSALARLEAAVGLVDHIGTAATTDHAVVAVAILERLQGIADLHDRFASLQDDGVRKARSPSHSPCNSQATRGALERFP